MDKLEKTEVEKSEVSHIESNIESGTKSRDFFEVEKPESLKQYSDEEIDKFHKKITRKVDLRLIPMLVFLYILNYLDRNNIASARLGALEEDLNLKGNQYETCISILFVGYILMQIPANMFLNKFKKPSIFLASIMGAWVQFPSVSSPSRALVDYLPCLYVLSCWYTRKQLGFRNSLLYSGSLLSGAFSGLIAAGIVDNMDHLHGLRSWRWLFIIEGGVTVGVAPLAYLVLPDMPHNSKMLNDFEKDVLLYKIRCETGQDDSDETNEESYWGAFKLAVCDVKVWACCGILSWLVSAAGVTNFFPSIVETLNFDRVITLCLTAPPYILAVISTFIWALHADKTGERFWHVVSPLLIALASFIISVSTLNTGARYFAMVIMVPSIYCSFTTILSWMSNSVPRPPLKRAIALSLLNCLSNSASIWNAYLYPSSAAPRYTVAFTCNCVFIALAIACAVALRLRLQILNRRIDNGTMNWENELGKGNDGSEVRDDFRYLI
ncbi:uncharacterized protein CXQ87_001287 [Candidozyma duobushaemuli]|uniref:Major facilitator superfamily (MFS) profile domain-containing protein n=1 Tax=Candidozyma duobushaemuli TaxID=1231522 RepID=A0A2V1AM99_9ASCO|nr:uncharacterized protein CXQ87_001287 [[Candida] duobushaemulonis]PVH18363.1 hypothetical protein CXQ87_001287 [[Candida] duobushaemulonis]